MYDRFISGLIVVGRIDGIIFSGDDVNFSFQSFITVVPYCLHRVAKIKMPVLKD